VTTVIETSAKVDGTLVINTQKKEEMRMKNTIRRLFVLASLFAVSVTFQGNLSTKGHK
jgi:hypothetical protein